MPKVDLGKQFVPKVGKSPVPRVQPRFDAVAAGDTRAVDALARFGAQGQIVLNAATAQRLNPEVNPALINQFFAAGNTMTVYAPEQEHGPRGTSTRYGLPSSIGGEMDRPGRVLGGFRPTSGQLQMQVTGSSGESLRGNLQHEWYHVYQNLNPTMRRIVMAQMLGRALPGGMNPGDVPEVQAFRPFEQRRELPFGIRYRTPVQAAHISSYFLAPRGGQ